MLQAVLFDLLKLGFRGILQLIIGADTDIGSTGADPVRGLRRLTHHFLRHCTFLLSKCTEKWA